MATVESAGRTHDRHNRRRPFASWMKRLASLKSSATSSTAPPTSEKKHHHVPTVSKAKKHWNGKNNPYPESGHHHRPPAPSVKSAGGVSSFAAPGSDRVSSFASFGDSVNDPPHRSNKSTAPTLATNAETVHSDGKSKAGTSNTTGTYDGGHANSTFSSPQNSQESLTTTLTTIQSTAPSGVLVNPAAPGSTTQSPVHFSHQYPISPPASAVPTHLQPQPLTYVAATSNGMLSDDASILTLASSSKRRRRNSLDTNASVRALAPSSLFGNSRESLPLSVLSTNVNSGVGAPALISERNSYYSAIQGIDGASVRSVGHGRTDSIGGNPGAT